MRIFYLADPVSIHTQRWLRFFSAAGHEIHLVNSSLQPQTVFDWPGAIHHNLPWPSPPVPGVRGLARLVLYTQGLRRLIRRLRPDILHAHYINGPGWYAALSGFRPLVMTAWGTDIFANLPHGPWPDRWLTGLALGRADLVTTDSQQLMDIMRPYLNSQARSELVRFGIDTQQFSPGPDRTWRRRLELGNAPVILSIRQCVRHYNIDTIVEALPLVRQAMPGAHLLVKQMGDQFLDSHPYNVELRSLIARLGLTNCVTFVPSVDYHDMPDLYRCANVVVSVPSWDGMPVSVLEAMASGVPIVASDLPALRELREYGAQFELVAPRDVAGLAQALVHLLQGSAQPESVARNLATVQNVGDYTQEMRRVEDMYAALRQRSARHV
jgi:glycosyltransferase involved in cell wall biosynthesis